MRRPKLLPWKCAGDTAERSSSSVARVKEGQVPEDGAPNSNILRTRRSGGGVADHDLVEGTEETGARGIIGIQALPMPGAEEGIAIFEVRQQDPGGGVLAAGNIAIRVLLVHPALLKRQVLSVEC